MVEIIKNIVAKHDLSGKRAKYPFAQLEIGDGFEIPMNPNHSDASIRVLANRNGKILDRKFRTSRDGMIMRVWRIS